MLLGMLFPQASSLSFLIQYILMILLFFSFLDIEISPRFFRGRIGNDILKILLANFSIALFAWLLLHLIGEADLSIAAFMTAISPTAMAAPVITGFLKGRTEYVVASVVITNVCVALTIPFILPLIAGTHVVISTGDVLQSVIVVVFVPFILSRLLGFLPSNVQKNVRRGKSLSFYFWLVNLFLTISKATAFILHDLSVPLITLLEIALVSLVISAVNFGVGAWLGGNEYRQEASQSLGQKNTSFTIWLALTFVTPLVALGPTFYIVYHNLYNSFQLYRFGKAQLRVDLQGSAEESPVSQPVS